MYKKYLIFVALIMAIVTSVSVITAEDYGCYIDSNNSIICEKEIPDGCYLRMFDLEVICDDSQPLGTGCIDCPLE